MVVIGFVALAIGIAVISNELSFRKKAVNTEGKVIATLGSTFDVKYFIADGTEKIKRFSVKSNHNRPGDAKVIWYLPEKPYKARLSNGTNGGRILLTISLVCLLLGFSPLFMKTRV